MSIEPLVGAVRLLAHPHVTGEMTDYVGSGTVMRASANIAKLVGFSGVMGIQHQALLAEALHERGYTVLYVERASGGRVALGELITEGDFAGHIRVDLLAAKDRVKKRKV